MVGKWYFTLIAPLQYLLEITIIASSSCHHLPWSSSTIIIISVVYYWMYVILVSPALWLLLFPCFYCLSHSGPFRVRAIGLVLQKTFTTRRGSLLRPLSQKKRRWKRNRILFICPPPLFMHSLSLILDLECLVCVQSLSGLPPLCMSLGCNVRLGVEDVIAQYIRGPEGRGVFFSSHPLLILKILWIFSLNWLGLLRVIIRKSLVIMIFCPLARGHVL